LREIAPRSVIDFGCGQGWLLAELASDRTIERLTGVDFSPESLAIARQRVGAFATHTRALDLHEGLVTCRDPVFLEHDAAAAVEVVEHLEPPQLDALTAVVFDFARPRRVVITTPNADYNVRWLRRHAHGRRHPDHRFEWSRGEFADWSSRVIAAYGYSVRIHGVGTDLPVTGPPTQMAVFDR
jgi:SAM-dependent methyltransferase